MNRERVLAAIELMKTAKNLFMPRWQTGTDSACSIEQLHACGNTACFAGYLAISPEWKKAGGERGIMDMPVYEGSDGAEAVAKYLDISYETAQKIVFGGLENYGYSNYYGKQWEKVNKDDVIAKLELVLKTEEIYDESV